ncbi:MAG TPA: AMP-dependent synthetase/ligase [Actinocatenispora sp.]
MRTYRVPPVDRPADTSLADAVFRNAADHPDTVAFRRWPDGADVTAAEFAAEVTAVAKGLAAAGVRAGDRVALLSATRYEWTVLDYAIWAAGAVVVPVYDTASVEQIRWILANSGAVRCVVENGTQAATVAAACADRPVPVWRLDEDTLGRLARRAAEVTDEEFERRRDVDPDDVATIIHTSGTTGRAKGVVVTHRNFLANLDGFLDRLGDVFSPGGAVVLFLSPAHIFTRTMQCAAVVRRVRVTHVPDPAELPASLAVVRPTVLPLVPRFMEKLRDAAPGGDAGAALGGRCAAIVVGGAPHGDDLRDFYRSAGIAVYEGYGLTEVAGPATINGPAEQRTGTVGRPLPGVAVRLADDGEIFIRGDCVSRAYHGDPAATADALVDGWLRTGDVGSLDDGYLRITGRKKELVITAGGKNVDVTALESRLRAHPLVGNAMVVGDRRPFVACLVFADRAALRARGRGDGDGDHDADPALRAEVEAAVKEANEAVSRAESIRAFRIVDDELSVANGGLTASLKIRRDVVQARYAAEIDALYRKARQHEK